MGLQTDPNLLNLTFREVCRPFADLVYEYYHEDENRISNLARSMPELVINRCAGFDFCDGLTARKRRFDGVIQTITNLNARVLHTEGRKNVFAAQSVIKSNINLEI